MIMNSAAYKQNIESFTDSQSVRLSTKLVMRMNNKGGVACKSKRRFPQPRRRIDEGGREGGFLV